MKRFKVEKRCHKNNIVLGEVVSTSLYETKEEAFRSIFDEAYKMFYELDNSIEIVIDPASDYATIVARFGGLESPLYSWDCEDTKEVQHD